MICVKVPKHLKVPFTMIVNFVHSASASSIEWVVKITEDYLRFVEILEITFHMNRLASGSIPVEGSSRNTIGGFPSIAIATESFLLLPPEYVPAHLFSNSLSPISLIFLATRPSRSPFGMPLRAAYSSRCSRVVRFPSSASNYGQYPMCFCASSI